MARLRLRSSFLRDLQLRVENFKSLDPKLDLGNALTVPDFVKAVDSFDRKIGAYNSLLATLDGLRSELRDEEKDLRDLSERMLLAVGARFGKNSAEYRQAGGTRKSERKKPEYEAKQPDQSMSEDGNMT